MTVIPSLRMTHHHMLTEARLSKQISDKIQWYKYLRACVYVRLVGTADVGVGAGVDAGVGWGGGVGD